MEEQQAPQSVKQKIIGTLADTRQQIVVVSSALPVEKREVIFLGEWALRDLLAHLIGWDYANIQAIHDIRGGALPRVLQHWTPDWKVFNDRLVKEYRRDSWEELMASLTWSEADLMRVLNALPEEDFQFDFGVRNARGRTITIAHHLQGEIDDEKEHYEQISRWIASWG